LHCADMAQTTDWPFADTVDTRHDQIAVPAGQSWRIGLPPGPPADPAVRCQNSGMEVGAEQSAAMHQLGFTCTYHRRFRMDYGSVVADGSDYREL
jgi:hypothetical protein